GSPFYDAASCVFAAGVLLVLFCFAALLFSGKRLNNLRRDLLSGKAGAVEGRIALDVAARKEGAYYRVAVANQTFGVRKNVFLAFKNGDPYRIYYAPHSKTLLSAEWLRD